jgi:hypothetical protein
MATLGLALLYTKGVREFVRERVNDPVGSVRGSVPAHIMRCSRGSY